VDEGTDGNSITVEVAEASLATASAVQASAGLSNAKLKKAVLQNAADAVKFKPGDTVLLTEAAKKDRAVIASIAGDALTFEADLINEYAAGTVRIADLEPNQTRIRLDAVGNMEPGTYVQISQNATTDSGIVASVEKTNGFITLSSALTKTFTMEGPAPVSVKTQEFKLVANTNKPGSAPRIFDNLSMDPRHSRYALSIVNEPKDRFLEVSLPDTPTPSLPPANLPVAAAGAPLENGMNDDLAGINDQHYTDAFDELEKIDDINMVCIPDRTDPIIQMKAKEHCEKMQDRFAILDSPPGYTSAQILGHRAQLESERGYAALYYPQLYIADPSGKGRIKMPPSGHVAGVYARTDNDKGVHKAPANEVVRGVLALERTLSDDDNGPLNEKSINVIRFLPGRGFRIWGARTIATETQWRYINVRRLLLFLEESIQEGTQFAVFEPNNTALWQKVKRTVSEFLDRVWRTGALIGDKPEEAYRVRIDDELNPPSTIALGQLVIEVRVAPTTPAEFVVFQIIQDPGRKIVKE
jgi:hypothetical protein